ncbi:MAG: SsrA-binding protein [Phycisphaerae bacterium]|nr:SsrA-binding protein [Phycisphaerae bacterium]
MAKKPAKKSGTPTVENRRARHEYHIGDTLEVGIVLAGTEVKAVRDGNVSIAEGYISVEGASQQLTLRNVSIGEYPPAGQMQHRMDRTRRLLAHRQEITRLARQVDQKGVTLVPLKLYFKDGWAKLLIGVGTGKQTHDKRHAIKDRESKRELQRAMSKRV